MKAKFRALGFPKTVVLDVEAPFATWFISAYMRSGSQYDDVRLLKSFSR